MLFAKEEITLSETRSIKLRLADSFGETYRTSLLIIGANMNEPIRLVTVLNSIKNSTQISCTLYAPT